MKRPYKIILAAIVILGVAALVLLLFVRDKQIKRLEIEAEAAKAKIADAATAGAVRAEDQSTSPYATATDFAKYAMKLREQGLVKVEPQVFAPISSRPATTRFAWKTNIVTTVFWIGELGKKHSLTKSAWDADWTGNYGGFDNPDSSARRNYIPVAFVPRQNPFYCALPYNDVTGGQFKPEAPLVIPWFKQAYTGPGQSVCKDRWIAIRKGNRTCYAQWEDCGPFRTDHFQYVFQNERPKPNGNHGAGLSVSPAVRDYLGLASTDVTDWQFVEVRDVPPGPWRSYGENNHFVIARRQLEQQLAQQKPPAAATAVPTETAIATPTPTAAALFNSTASGRRIIEEGGAIVYGSDYAFGLKAPKGWMLDNQSGVEQGIHPVFYPKGSNWKDSPVVIYARSRPKTDNNVTADDAAKFDVEEFHANGSPEYQAKRIKTLKTDSGREAVIYHFSGDQWGNSEAVAYYVEDKSINFVVMNSRDPKLFADSLEPFEALVKSYIFITDHVDKQQ